MSAANPKPQEPSMEEILTSIRRIIAEDQGGAPQRPPVPPLTASLGGRDPSGPTSPGDATPVTALAPRVPADREDPGLRAGEPASIVSSTTEAAVADAFGRLAATPVPPPLRSLEDAVSEMLRPMLKTWLDDNLPSLVERLVKAEIERLTRAAR